MKKFFLVLLIVTLALAISLRIRYGGGQPYPDLSTEPLIEEDALEEVFAYLVADLRHSSDFDAWIAEHRSR